MKNEVAGVAGAARIYQMTRADLTHAERHGKRLDATGKSRAINDEPPITTDGLDLNALFEKHVAGAFVPRAHAKAMHMLVQFPKDLVNGDDAALLLRHARAFAKRVFGNDAIFADRVDRDEKSRHVVDVFVAPKYVKKTRHQEKVAVSMTHHLKALARQYGQPTGPHGCARALQDALFEYLRDEMCLVGVKRGSPKQVPGPDWKSSEQQRVEELDELKAQADARNRTLAERERQLSAASEDLASREAMIAAQEKEIEIARDAVVAERAAVEQHRVTLDAASEAAEQARRGAAADAALAAHKVVEAEATQAAAIVQRETAEALKLELAGQRSLHLAQLALLARAADDNNGLNLRLGPDTFTISEHRMTDAERDTNRKPWSRPLVAIARSLAAALDVVRELAHRLGMREKAIAAREVAAKAEESRLFHERATHDAQRAEHLAAVADLDRQRHALTADETRIAKAAADAEATLKKAMEAQANADAMADGTRRWSEVIDAVDKNPDIIEHRDDGTFQVNRYMAAVMPQMIVATLREQPPTWANTAITTRHRLAVALGNAVLREKDADYALERLEDLIKDAGPIMTPVQEEFSQTARKVERQHMPWRNEGNDYGR